MTAVRKLRRKLYLLEVYACLAIARLLVRFVPFRLWQGTLGPVGEEPATGEHLSVTPAQVAHARATGTMVARMARRVWFKPVCLPQAMAARWLLARRGTPSRVVFGSRRNPDDRALLLHAWLMVGDEVVTGARERAQFIAFRSATQPDGGNGAEPELLR
jgi:hypothetical protein